MMAVKTKIRKIYKIIWCPKNNNSIPFSHCIKKDCCIEYDLNLEEWVRCGVTKKKHVKQDG